MKCWKCGQELVNGVDVCPYCGTAQSRPAPYTEVGKALRMLFDRYGAETVLSNAAYLTNGLADAASDTKKIRNQLRMALDAGIGRVYLDQIPAGAPDSGFDQRVRVLLTDEAGLSDKAAEELAGYFDEMIGWRAPVNGRQGAERPAQAQSRPVEQPRPRPQAEVPRHVPGQGEVDRTGRYTQGTGAGTQRETPRQTDAQSQKKPVWPGLYPYEKAAIVCLILALVGGNVINSGHDPEFVLDYAVSALMLIPFFMSFSVKKGGLRTELYNGPIWLTVIIAALLVFVGGDLIHKINLINSLQTQTSSGAAERLAWQKHLATENSILVATTLLLFIQMLRHRKLEKNA